MKSISAMGEEVPAIGLGTWLLTGEACIRAVVSAISIGYRHIDTARNYGNETEVGEGIRRAGVERESIFLVTKVPPSRFTYKEVLRSAEESLRSLAVDYVDLLLLHWPNPSVPLEETLGAMNELQSAGKTRYIGVSNFSPSLVEEAAGYSTIFCNQVEFSPYEPQDELLAQSREMGYLFVAYTPLARGRVSQEPLLKQLGAKYGKSPEQVTLRWLIQQDVCAIPKAASEAHQRANIDIFDFELSDEEMRAISSLSR